MSEWDSFPQASEWDAFPVESQPEPQQVAPMQGDPSAGAWTLQFGPIDTGIAVPQGANRFLIGIGKALSDLGLGSEQFVRGMVPGVSPREAELNTEATARRERDAPLMDTGAGMAGNIVGNVIAAAPTMAVPGVNTYTGAAALGGMLGALQPTAEGESRLTNAGIGAAGGVIGKGVVSGVSRALSPKTSQAARALLDEGVPLTPGQIAGGAAKRIEEGAKSMPVVGDFVRGAERRAMEGWNKAALNRVLAPIGQKVSKVGREGLEEAQQKLSAAYDDLLPKIRVKVDRAFTGDLNTLLNSANGMPQQRHDQLVNIVRTQVVDKMTKTGRMSGETMKQVDSELGRLARGYLKSEDFDSRQLGSAVREIQSLLRDVVKRSNPALKKELERIDKGYSMLLRVENAGARAGAHEGVFSPAQLKAASRQMDSSLRKRAFAQGRANMQNFAEDAQAVIGNTVPDSGTPFRVGNALLMGGGYAIDPTIAASMAGGSAVYSAAGRKLMELALARRPELIRQGGNALARFGPAGAIAGSTLTNN